MEFSSKLSMGKPRLITLFNEPWQLMRHAEGHAICLPGVEPGR